MQGSLYRDSQCSMVIDRGKPKSIKTSDSGSKKIATFIAINKRKHRVSWPSAILPRVWPARCYKCLEVGYLAGVCQGPSQREGDVAINAAFPLIG